MRIPRVFTTQPLSAGGTIQLEVGVARHLTSVLRMVQGQNVILFDGRDGEYNAELICVKKGAARAKVGGFVDTERESPLKIELAIGISRGERMA